MPSVAFLEVDHQPLLSNKLSKHKAQCMNSRGHVASRLQVSRIAWTASRETSTFAAGTWSSSRLVNRLPASTKHLGSMKQGWADFGRAIA